METLTVSEFLDKNPEINPFINVIPQTLPMLLEMENHSPWTAIHLLKTGIIQLAILNGIDLTLDQKNISILGAIWHDVGKIKIPTWVLDGDLNLEERMKYLDPHPETGKQIILESSIDPELRDQLAKRVVRHHEFQPRPYPRSTARLGSPEVLIDSYLISLADGVDAAISKRPYKEAWSPEDTFEFLRNYYPENFLQKAILARMELNL